MARWVVLALVAVGVGVDLFWQYRQGDPIRYFRENPSHLGWVAASAALGGVIAVCGRRWRWDRWFVRWAGLGIAIFGSGLTLFFGYVLWRLHADPEMRAGVGMVAASGAATACAWSAVWRGRNTPPAER